MPSETERFLGALFESTPPDLWTLFWTLRDKRSCWQEVGDSPVALAAHAEGLSVNSDVYVAVSVAEEAAGPFKRVNNTNSAGIMGLWADIDIANPDVHKKWNLPPDEDSAIQLLESCGLEPTLLVHSGHGLQAWWLFDEFWRFESTNDRSRAASLAHAWNTTLRVRAAQHDWTVDSTFDLARVMRVPGTFNRKTEPHEPVRLLNEGKFRYGRSDFDPFCVDDHALAELGLSPSRVYVVEPLKLVANATPPFQKFQELLANNRQFRAAWERTNKSLSDQSPSSYDLSLANLAVSHDWSDQEIADLIIASRTHHKDDVSKALRQDYMSRTISRARDGVAKDVAIEAMDDVVVNLDCADRSGDDEARRERRREAMDSVSQQLGFEVIRVIKYLSDPPTFRFITPTVAFGVGGAGDILNWHQLRQTIAGATRHVIPRFRMNTWDQLCQVIFRAAEEQDVGQEATETGLTSVWLSEYLMARPPVDDTEQAILTEHPYVDNGDTYIFGSSFKKWLWLNRSERVNQKDLGRLLRLYGCEPIKVNIYVEGGRTSRSAWKLPAAAEVNR